MNESVLKTIELVKSEVQKLEAQLLEKKRLANGLCELAGQPPIFDETEKSSSLATLAIRGDQYYGKSMSTAIREVLERRRAAELGPAKVAEIYDALSAGGFRFDAANEANAKKSVRICMTKNTSIFHKLPNGTYGLSKWYPKLRLPKTVKPNSGTSDDEQSGRAVMEKEFGNAEGPDGTTSEIEESLGQTMEATKGKGTE